MRNGGRYEIGHGPCCVSYCHCHAVKCVIRPWRWCAAYSHGRYRSPDGVTYPHALQHL